MLHVTAGFVDELSQRQGYQLQMRRQAVEFFLRQRRQQAVCRGVTAGTVLAVANGNRWASLLRSVEVFKSLGLHGWRQIATPT